MCFFNRSLPMLADKCIRKLTEQSQNDSQDSFVLLQPVKSKYVAMMMLTAALL
jgi:hypothetical protein